MGSSIRIGRSAVGRRAFSPHTRAKKLARAAECLVCSLTPSGVWRKTIQKLGFRWHLAGSKMPRETFFTAISRWRVVSRRDAALRLVDRERFSPMYPSGLRLPSSATKLTTVERLRDQVRGSIFLNPRGLTLDQRSNHRIRRQNSMCEGRPIDFVRCTHCLGAECRCCIPHQRHVVA